MDSSIMELTDSMIRLLSSIPFEVRKPEAILESISWSVR